MADNDEPETGIDFDTLITDWEAGNWGVEADDLDLLYPSPVDEKDKLSRKDLKKRMLRGMSDIELWNIFHVLYRYYAAYFRAHNSPEANTLLQCLIDLNEAGAMNTIGFPAGDVAARDEAYRTHGELYKVKYEEALIIWPKLYTLVVPVTGAKQTDEMVDSLIDRLVKVDGPWVWEEVQNILPDPTVVDKIDKVAHFNQRALYGYSEWDVANFDSYIHWLLMNAVLFYGSDTAMGHPGLEGGFPTWVKELRLFLEGMIYGTYKKKMTADENSRYQASVGLMLEVLPHLWD